MDLLCCENECECRAYADPALLNDDRVLRNLLNEEDRFAANISYFERVQKELSPDMRRIVADWMMEVRTVSIISKSAVSCQIRTAVRSTVVERASCHVCDSNT